jgi:hypothetical protein
MVLIDQVAQGFVVPLAVLLVAARDLESRPSAVDAGDAPAFASGVWRRIVDRFPSVGCSPLEPAVERATKRTALVLIGRRRRAAVSQETAVMAHRIVGPAARYRHPYDAASLTPAPAGAFVTGDSRMGQIARGQSFPPELPPAVVSAGPHRTPS